MLYFLDITICEDVIPIFFAKVTSTPQLLLIFLHLIPSVVLLCIYIYFNSSGVSMIMPSGMGLNPSLSKASVPWRKLKVS